jgi:glucokinase
MYLGMEIGGTKLQLALGEGDGSLAGLWRARVDPAAGGPGIRRQIVQGAAELLERTGLKRDQVVGVGIGFGGPVDDIAHTVITSHQIAGWDDFPLPQWIGDTLGWRAVLGNDADLAGLAEARFGAGRGLSPIFYITIGSGIGGGLIVDGQIYRGSGRGAAEIGHLRLPIVWEQGLRYVTLEEIASGWGIAACARREASDPGARGLLAEMTRSGTDTITARDVAAAALGGDEHAGAILRRAWEALAEAISQVIALLAPRRLVIGGGVSLMGERILFEPLCRLVADRVFAPCAGRYDIVPAALGEEVVLHGALVLARMALPE